MELRTRIEKILEIDPPAPAIEFEGRWRSWERLSILSSKIRQLLAREGLGRGTRTGILLRNHAAIVPAVLAVFTAEGCLVTLNPTMPSEKLRTDVLETKVPVIIGLARDLDPLSHSLENAGSLVIELPEDEGEPRVRRRREPSASHRIASEGIAVEMLTSGTTGEPKRIPMSREGFERSVFAAARFEKGRSSDDRPQLRGGVQLLMAPFAHMGGLLALMNAIVAGRSSALLPKFDVDGFREAVGRHGIKVASAPPAALKMILEAAVPIDELKSLRAFRTGTAPLDPELADAFYERYGIPVLQNYGATEFGGVAGWTLADFEEFRTSKRGAVGRLNPGIEGRIVDPDTNDTVPLGERGILELKAGQFGDGNSLVRTTDFAKIDSDGFLFILGRADNVIIRGGFKVHPDDLVRTAEAHPAIHEAVVVGLPDERLGQVPVLAYVAKSGVKPPTEDELLLHLRSKLAQYQVPVAALQFNELPRTPSMKVDQAALIAAIREASQPGQL